MTFTSLAIASAGLTETQAIRAANERRLAYKRSRTAVKRDRRCNERDG